MNKKIKFVKASCALYIFISLYLARKFVFMHFVETFSSEEYNTAKSVIQ